MFFQLHFFCLKHHNLNFCVKVVPCILNYSASLGIQNTWKYDVVFDLGFFEVMFQALLTKRRLLLSHGDKIISMFLELFSVITQASLSG